MDIIEALRTVDEGMLARAEHPLEQRRGIGNGIKIAIAAVLVIAIGVGGFLLLQNRSAPEPGPQPAYTLPVFDTQEPTDTRPLTDTQKPTDTWVSELPIAYAANWAALQKVWAEEGSLLAIANGIAVEHTVTYYGDVPEEFRDAIRHNALYGAKVCGDRLIRAASDDGRVTVWVYDKNGKERVRAVQNADGNHGVAGMTATSDRGLLFALGYWDDLIPTTYGGPGEAQTGGSGVYSTVTKCGADGTILWSIRLEQVSRNRLLYCFEADGAYYFFGKQESDDSGTQGVSLLRLNADGSVREQTVLDGSTYDRLRCAAQTEDGFALYVTRWDADRLYRNYVIRLDTELNVLSTAAAPEDFDEYGCAVGAVDGETLLSGDERLADFPYGNLDAVVDLGDRLLTVSEYFNDTPYGKRTGADCLTLASRGGNTRPDLTVYAMFDKQNGTLLWRAMTTAVPVDQSDGELNGSVIVMWDEEERPLPGWRVRVPERGSDEPGDEELYLRALQTIVKQEYVLYLAQNREELEAIAKDMLRLQAQTGDERGMKTMYFSGLQYDASAQTDVDVGALEARIRKLGGFDSISVRDVSFLPETDAMCYFHFTKGDEEGNTYHIQLSWCELHPEYEPDPDPNVYGVRLDDHWYFWCRYDPAEG